MCLDGAEDTLILKGFDEGTLWVRQLEGDLVINALGGAENSVTFQGWFEDNLTQIDAIETEDMVLLRSNVDKLVQAMASFNAQDGVSELSLQETKDQMATSIAEAWQPKTEMI